MTMRNYLAALRDHWFVYLPALGVFVTTCLVILVNRCLLAKVPLQSDFPALQVRSFADKKSAEEKGKARNKEEAPAPRVAVELGTIQEIIAKFPQRARNLDVRTRTLSFLTTWSVANIVQGALTVVVLALSISAVRRYWPGESRRAFLIFPAGLIAFCVVLVFVADFTGAAPLSMKNSVNDLLQAGIRKATNLETEGEFLTTLGNVSIGLVTFFASFSLCVILYPSEDRERASENRQRRFQEFQQLMYWSAFLLVVGVVQVAYQNRMPSLFFDDEFNVQQIAQMASGVGLLVGGVFSVALALVFLPAGFLLAGPSVPENGPGQAVPKKSWFTEIIAVLAPLLTALPIGKLFDIAI